MNDGNNSHTEEEEGEGEGEGGKEEGGTSDLVSEEVRSARKRGGKRKKNK